VTFTRVIVKIKEPLCHIVISHHFDITGLWIKLISTVIKHTPLSTWNIWIIGCHILFTEVAGHVCLFLSSQTLLRARISRKEMKLCTLVDTPL